MTGKAILWWRSQRGLITTFDQAKASLIDTYGDKRKKKDSANLLTQYSQGSKTISDFFVEVEHLNRFAQLDSEILPTFLEKGLNEDLQRALNQHRPAPTTYAEWKRLALDIGGGMEVLAPKPGKRGFNNKDKDRKARQPKQSNQSNQSHQNTTAKTTRVSIPQAELDRRMNDDECLKCGRKGHIGKECRTGYQYNPPATEESAETPAVKSMEGGRKRKRGTGRNETPVNNKRRNSGKE